MKQIRLLLAVLALAVAGCASTGGAAEFRRDVGTASGPDALERSTLVLRQYHYEVARQEEAPSLVVETHWRSRPLFDDEQAQGLAEAESRVVVTGRQRVDTLLGSVYSLTLVVQNRVRRSGEDQWIDTVNSRMFAEYAAEMAKRLEEEIRTIGVRRF